MLYIADEAVENERMYQAIRASLLLMLVLFSSAASAREWVMTCTYTGFKKGKPDAIELGKKTTVTRQGFDFSVEGAFENSGEFHAVFGDLHVLASIDTPRRGWVGINLSSSHNQGSSWTCIPARSGQRATLAQTQQDLTVLVECRIGR